MGVLDDHDCESNSFWMTFGLDTKWWVFKGCFMKHHDCVKRVVRRWGEVDYGYLTVHGVKIV